MSSSDGRPSARVLRGDDSGWRPASLAALSPTRGIPGSRGGVSRHDGRSRREQTVEERIAAAFQQGVVEGLHRAATEAQQAEQALGATLQARFGALEAGLETGFRALESGLADRVLALAMSLAARIACREISTAPDAIEAVVGDALRLVTERYRQIEIIANPADHERLARWIDAQAGNASWSIRPDASVTPGGCLLRVDDTSLDATVETRLKRGFEALGMPPPEELP